MKTRQELTPKQDNFRKQLLARVHLSPKYTEHYAYHHDDYRMMLTQYFGVQSSADLSIDELIVLVKFLTGRVPEPVVRASKTQTNFIRQLWKQKAHTPTENALKQFICAIYGWTPINLGVLSKEQANGVIGAIRKLSPKD